MTPLSRIWSEPVGVTAGGHIIFIRELRLRDLASAQVWIESYVPHPFDAAAAEGGDDLEAVRAALQRRHDEVFAYPPIIGTPEARKIMPAETRDTMFLLCGMKRVDAKTLFEDASRCRAAMSPAEWRRAERILFGVPAWVECQEFLAAMAGHTEEDDGFGPPDWGREVAEFCLEHGFTPDQVANFTLSQWRLLRSGGKADAYKPLSKPGMTFGEMGEYNRAIWGLSEGNAAGGDEGGMPPLGV